MTPTPSPTATTADSEAVAALPNWLLVSLLILVAIVILAMFALTFYKLSAPRSTMKNILGLKRSGKNLPEEVKSRAFEAALEGAEPGSRSDQKLVSTLGLSARVGKRTTRTTLAIAGFSLLGIVVVASFGLSGSGVRDMRSQLVASVTTLVAAIAGLHFGSQSSGSSSTTITGPGAGGLAELVPEPSRRHRASQR